MGIQIERCLVVASLFSMPNIGIDYIIPFNFDALSYGNIDIKLFNFVSFIGSNLD